MPSCRYCTKCAGSIISLIILIVIVGGIIYARTQGWKALVNYATDKTKQENAAPSPVPSSPNLSPTEPPTNKSYENPVPSPPPASSSTLSPAEPPTNASHGYLDCSKCYSRCGKNCGGWICTVLDCWGVNATYMKCHYRCSSR